MALAFQDFTGSLQTLSDEDLSVLLMRRPGAAAVARASQPSWADLAAALLRPRDLALTLSRLDRFLGQVVELAALENGELAPGVAANEGLEAADLERAGGELRRWGVAAADRSGALRLAPGVESMVWDPGRLGRPAVQLLENLNAEELRQIAMLHGLSGAALPKHKAELVRALHARLTDPDRILALLRAAPPAARTALEALRRAGGSTSGAAAGPAWARSFMSWSWHARWGQASERDGPAWLTTRGMVLPEHEQRVSVAVPREIERALRGRVFARWDVAAPALALAPAREERHPIDLVIAVETLLEAWRHSPPPALKDGGVPKREIKRAAQRIGWSEGDADLLVRLAGAARLLRERELVPEKRSRSWRRPHVLQSRRAVVEPSAEAERWLALPEVERWLELARFWVSAVGADGAGGDARNSRERLVLELLGEIVEGKGASAESIGAALSWRSPGVFADGNSAAAVARGVGYGLALLGAGAAEPVICIGAVGRQALLSGGAVDAGALQAAFPPVADRCVVTADHRVMVSGPPNGELAALLRRIADVVSVRPARVYRITEAALGRALDGGLTASAILDALRRDASEPVPPNVVTLIEDVARRHGRLRVGTASVYVVADDAAQLELVARDRAIGGSRLRRIAPTVAVIEGRDAGEVMAALRRAGLMPVADGSAPPAPSGAAQAPRPRPARAEPGPPASAAPAALDAAEADRFVAILRAAPVPTARAIATAPSPEEAMRAVLADAARGRRSLEFGYRGASGWVEILTAAPYQLHRDHVYVHQAQAGGFALDLRRILWAVPADGSRAAVDPSEIDVVFDDDPSLDDDDDADGDLALLELERLGASIGSAFERRRRR